MKAIDEIAAIELVRKFDVDQRPGVNPMLLILIDEGHSAPDIGMLLPDRDYNQCLLERLSSVPVKAQVKGAFVGLFLADPFLHLPSVLPILKSAGVTGVANFPSTSFYGVNFSRQLDEVGFSRKVEFERLNEVRQSGLEVLGCMHVDDTAETMLQAQEVEEIGLWLLHGGLDSLFRSSVSPASFPDVPANAVGDWFLYDPDVTPETLPPSYAGYAKAQWWR